MNMVLTHSSHDNGTFDDTDADLVVLKLFLLGLHADEGLLNTLNLRVDPFKLRTSYEVL